eukprot:scaffold1673_cov330-Pavlova_lutheri.AAC.12
MLNSCGHPVQDCRRRTYERTSDFALGTHFVGPSGRPLRYMQLCQPLIPKKGIRVVWRDREGTRFAPCLDHPAQSFETALDLRSASQQVPWRTIPTTSNYPVQMANAMATTTEVLPFKEIDANAAKADALDAIEVRKQRNTLAEMRKFSLLDQCCVEQCNPFDEPTVSARMMAWERLVMALELNPNGLFIDCNLNLDIVRRQLGILIKAERKRNMETREAIRRGGTHARAEVEELF